LIIKAFIIAVIVHLLQVPATLIYILAGLAIALSVFEIWVFKTFERILISDYSPSRDEAFYKKWTEDIPRKNIFSNIVVLPVLLISTWVLVGQPTVMALFTAGIFISTWQHLAHISNNFGPDIQKLRGKQKK
jgi:Kef-type K+ transport system membrane component KefB